IRLVATIEDMDKSQNLFYADTRAYNNSIMAILHQLSPTPLLEFPVFLPIIREYEASFEEDDLGIETNRWNPLQLCTSLMLRNKKT
ncbi:hypothetical protein J1N35_040841, partial [Gossypium stocksii]